ncbi:ligase-associated DNA damage response exonuclease [Gemmatimonas sp. UBA7669]|uniref:ligase-associated DNA damage response exonuclease n=1 Tax=Gemmatimonas sp. UBA7669 TaxID=1946568 RepID=UPI0025BA3A52|nr:ligase-associated DNA damage response exonuclease [Gemmatimonas sp. UBA7669]
MSQLLTITDRGLYCEAGDFFIDPWRPVPRAVVTHAHGDHLTWGCERYLVSREGEAVTRERLGQWARGAESRPYGQSTTINGVTVSLHPAGHILGSAQVRVEHRGEVWVVSGDYKTDPDPTCTPWEPVRCHTFITESTFGLPIYRWSSQAQVFADINAWWAANAAEHRVSLLCGYALGKAQRMLAGLDPTIGPILLHGAVDRMTTLYRAAGVALPATRHATEATADAATRALATQGALLIAPPSVIGTTWLRRFGELRTAFASGWMRVRGARRRRGVDAGFTLSDHVDWPQLLAAIDATGAEQVWVTHGFTDQVVRWLREHGRDAHVLPTHWGDSEQEERGDAE